MSGNKPNISSNEQAAPAITPPPQPPVSQPPVSVGGYGSSSFGEPAKPQATPPSAPAAPSAPTNVPESIAQAPVITAVPRTSRGRGSLVLTIVGVIVFIGGVSGLFVYALSGQ